jgi:hypothetical protein
MFDFEVDALFHVEVRPKQGCQRGWRQAAGNNEGKLPGFGVGH